MVKNDKETMEQNEKEIITTTEEEPEINYWGVKAMPFIIGNETFEKLGVLGTIVNLLIYLTTVFNMKSITAATLINVFSGTTNFATLLGAFVSDSYFGRYKTIGFSTISSFLGLSIIALTAAIKELHPPKCMSNEESDCITATPWQMAFLLMGFGFLVVGAGGVRPCNLAFGADQFNPKTESGKRGINSFFNWYYFILTFAIMISLTLIVYVQSDVSWGVGLAIPAIFMLIACVLFYAGMNIYVKVKPEGSPITTIVQVFVVAGKKRKLLVPDQPWLSLYNYIPPNSINSKLPHTKQFRFLDKAAIMTAEDRTEMDRPLSDPWKLCSMQKVEEVKCVLRVIPIWIAGMLYSVSLTQQQTYSVFQALQSDRHPWPKAKFQIPAASYPVFTMLTVAVFIPVYDRVIVPMLRRLTGEEGGITLLQRMGIGVGLSALTSLVAALVENWRRTVALTESTLGIQPRRGAISSMSASWLIPQLVVAGLAEAFADIGQLEFYYKQFPENMRSFAGSFYFCGVAVSNYLTGFLISIVHRTTQRNGVKQWLPEDLNKGRLDYYYYMIAGIATINLGYFVLCSRWYHYKETGAAAIEVEKTGNDESLV